MSSEVARGDVPAPGRIYMCLGCLVFGGHLCLGVGTPWVPPLLEASLPCNHFVLCVAAPAPLGFCAGGRGPSDGRF